MNELLKKVYGLILVSDVNTKQQLFNAIEPEWNETAFEQSVYKCIDLIFNDNDQPDIMTLTMKFREKGLLSKFGAIEISKLTNSVHSASLMEIDQTLALLNYQKSVRKAKKTIAEMTRLVESENYTESKFVDIMTNASVSMSDKKSELVPNIDLWSKVMIRHDYVAAGKEFGLELPYSTLKTAITLEPVDMLVVGARPAMGKTAFAVSTAVGLARRGKKVALFALEMSAEQITRRIIGCAALIDTMKIKYGRLSDQEKAAIYNAQEKELLDNIYIFDGSHDIRQIQDKVSDLKMNEGVDVFIVDYLQKVISKKPSRYEQVTEVSNKIKLISQTMKVPSIALAQLSRDSGRSGKLPSLPDLRESGEIEQDASIVAFLHRPEYYGEELTSEGNDAAGKCEFLIAKNREGVVDVFELDVNLAYSRFTDVNSYNTSMNNHRPIDVDYSADNPF